MKRLQSNLIPMPVGRFEPEIEWSSYPRIEPGEYLAYCRAARWYFDPQYRRWVCLLRFDVLSPNMLDTVARVPFFLNGGDGERPRAGRRSRYFREWTRVNGRPPARGDRLSPQVFVRRMARVEVGDTDHKKSPAPYSVVRRVVSWETGGNTGHSVSKSPSQGTARKEG
jgi:hypothetical protein